MPPFLSVIRTCDRGMREYLFKQLGQIMSIIKQHARNYMPEIFSIIRVRAKIHVCMYKVELDYVRKLRVGICVCITVMHCIYVYYCACMHVHVIFFLLLTCSDGKIAGVN